MRFNEGLDKTEETVLVRQSARGDLQAFNELVLQHQDLVYHHALALLGDPAGAEDAAQDAFIRAFHNIRTFRDGSFRGWLLKITTNACYDQLRRMKRRPAVPLFPEDEYGEEMESPAWLADGSLSPEAQVEAQESADHIHRVLDSLPAAFRSVLTLVDLYELDYAEAADILKVPLGTVKSRLARARVAMRDSLLQGQSSETRRVPAGNQRSISSNALP